MVKIRILYTIAVLALVALLFMPDPLTRKAAGVLLLIGAIPIYRTLAREHGLNALRAADLHHEDERHTLSTDPASEDQIPIQR